MSVWVLFTRLLTSLTMKATMKLMLEEWSDDPEHAKLVETDRKLREQEQKDADVVKKYQEMYDKNKSPREEDREVAMMIQKLYDQKATEAEIANVTANQNLSQEVEPTGADQIPMEGVRRDVDAAVQVDENGNESL